MPHRRNPVVLSLFFSCVLLTLLFTPAFDTYAAETVVVAVKLNDVDKGEFFVVLDGGDFLIRKSDLEEMGLRSLEGETSWLEGEAYMLAKSLKGVDASFDENTLTLKLTAHPALLPKTTITLGAKRPPGVVYPGGNSAFLNYGVDYSASMGAGAGPGTFRLANQLGIRATEALFLTDTAYASSGSESSFVRLQSSLTRDIVPKARRLVLGDFTAGTGPLGSSLNMGGLGFIKVYGIDPYLTKYPLLGLSGYAALPSEVEVFVDGRRVYNGALPPGEFELRNLIPLSGAGIVEIALKDSFGNVHRTLYPVYLSRELLNEGFSEYGYGVGFKRENYGLQSNDYGPLSFSAFHNYGMTDSLTVGARAEGSGGIYGFGASAASLIGHLGMLSVAATMSSGAESDAGYGGRMTYGYQGKVFSPRLNMEGFSRDFTYVSGIKNDERLGFGASIGFALGTGRSIVLGYDKVDYFTAPEKSSYSAGYAMPFSVPLLGIKASLTTRLSYVDEGAGAGTAFYVNVLQVLGGDKTVSVSSDVSGEDSRIGLDVQKRAPLGEGYGYGATLQRNVTGGAETVAFNPKVQYNAKFGIFGASYGATYGETAGTDYYTLSASGGIALIGGAVGLGRPVNDSFALVRVGDLADVDVFVGGEKVSSTDEHGRVLVPSLPSYSVSQVSIRPNDVPLDYMLVDNELSVSMPHRGGGVIDFMVKRFHAYFGRLLYDAGKGPEPAEYFEMKLKGEGVDTTFPTATGGDFYIEDIAPGTYTASFEDSEAAYVCILKIPDTAESLVELGDVLCEAVSR